jgi:signal transduction histidine kinase
MKIDLSSLRTRFIVATALWITIGLLLTGILVSKIVREYVIEGFHEEMEVHIEELAALTSVDDSGQPFLLRHLSDPRFIPKDSGFYWQVERAGQTTIRSPSLGGASLPTGLAVSEKPKWEFTPGPKGQTLEYGRIKTMPNGEPPLSLYIATDKRLMDEVLAEIDWPLLYSLGSFAAIMVLLGAIQINYSLRPLQRMTNAIADIRDGHEQRMVGQYPAEIKPLVSDLNQLLDANWEMVQSARVQAGNLAHGLRTPLAVMTDEAQIVEKKGDAESAAVFLQGCQQMQRYIDYYTTRARMAATARLPGHRASLVQTLEPIVSAMRRLYRETNIQICVGSFPDVDTCVEDVDLEEMTSNLLDNACKWATSRVIVSWEARDRMVIIDVDDDGIGIRPEYREKAFDVGERLDRSAMGTGLGLAIVRDLALHYRGNVGMSDSPLGGLRVTLTLPVHARQAGFSKTQK